jgi:serine/threonine-protein kinase
VFLAARERDAEARASFLTGECAGDDALRAEVESLLAADRDADRVDALAESWREPWEGDAPPAEGVRVGPYRLLEILGSGGMGTVWLAERDDDQFRQQVALKVLRAEANTPELRHRFRNERQILARLTHPNIARLHDGGITDDGRPWFAMEHVPGQPLDRFCAERRLAVPERVALLMQACDAVEHAHGKLVVHRDLKPSNILVTADGDVRLLDFGIAKLIEPESDPDGPTRTGTRAMTPDYASPEQVRGEPVTTESDVYSLGVVLFEILTERRPHSVAGLSPSEAERVICGDDAPAPSTVAAEPARRRILAGDLDTIVAKALQKEPDRRYRSVAELHDDLRRYLEGRPVLARPDTASYRLRKFVRRHRWGVLAVAAMALSLMGGIAGTAWQARRAGVQAAVAAGERDRAQQVTRVLVGMFEAADPLQAGGDAVSARAVLDRGRRWLDSAAGQDEAVRATLMLTMGKAYGNLALYDEAESLVTGALRERRALAGTDEDLAVAEALSELGALHQHLGRHDEARDALRQALDVRRRLLGEIAPEVAAAWNNLGSAFHSLSLVDSAVVCYRRAAELWERLPPEGNGLAGTLGDLGTALGHAGEEAAADSLLRRAIALHREEPPGDALAAALNNLALVRAREGDAAGAEPLLRESIAIRERILGEGHPVVATVRNNLAAILERRGKLDEAEPLYRAALAEKRVALGDLHPSVARSLNNLGILVQKRGDLDEAGRLLTESLEIRKRVWTADHPEVARGLHNLAFLRALKEDPAGAEPLYREALAMRRSLLGDDADETRETAANLAGLLEKAGRTAEAEALRAIFPQPVE